MVIVSANSYAVVITLPLFLIYRRVNKGKANIKKPLFANLALFFVIAFVCAGVFLKQGAAAASEAAASGSDIATAPATSRRLLPSEFPALRRAKAVQALPARAIGALAEEESTFGKVDSLRRNGGRQCPLRNCWSRFIIVSNLG
jgi:hypothetical protein